MEVEDEIELADARKELVEQFDEQMDRLQIGQLVVVHVQAEGKVQACGDGACGCEEKGRRRVTQTRRSKSVSQRCTNKEQRTESPRATLQDQTRTCIAAVDDLVAAEL